jgi:hypothetical protein
MAGTEKQREEINRKLVSMQMEMIGLTYDDAVNTPEFWRVYTLTTAQTLEWRKAALPLIKKTFKCNKRRAELTMGMFELNLGLREFNPPEEEFDTTHIHTTIPEPHPHDLFSEAHLIKDQEPTFWQKIKKFFVGYYN